MICRLLLVNGNKPARFKRSRSYTFKRVTERNILVKIGNRGRYLEKQRLVLKAANKFTQVFRTYGSKTRNRNFILDDNRRRREEDLNVQKQIESLPTSIIDCNDPECYDCLPFWFFSLVYLSSRVFGLTWSHSFWACYPVICEIFQLLSWI